jgi:hypothetical protein
LKVDTGESVYLEVEKSGSLRRSGHEVVDS